MKIELLVIANSARWNECECYTLIKGSKIYDRIMVKRIG